VVWTEKESKNLAKKEKKKNLNKINTREKGGQAAGSHSFEKQIERF